MTPEGFITKLFEISDKSRIKVVGDKYKIKGEIDGKFYSLWIINDPNEGVELVVRDYTKCKATVMNIWDGEEAR